MASHKFGRVCETEADLDRMIEAQSTRGPVTKTDCGTCCGYRTRDGGFFAWDTAEEFRSKTLESLHTLMELTRIIDVEILGEHQVLRFSVVILAVDQ